MREIHRINSKKHAPVVIIYFYDIYYLNSHIGSDNLIAERNLIRRIGLILKLSCKRLAVPISLKT